MIIQCPCGSRFYVDDSLYLDLDDQAFNDMLLDLCSGGEGIEDPIEKERMLNKEIESMYFDEQDDVIEEKRTGWSIILPQDDRLDLDGFDENMLMEDGE